MGNRIRKDEFPAPSAIWSNSRAQPWHQRQAEGGAEPFARADVKEAKWPGYPSLSGTPASVRHKEIGAGGHVFGGSAPTFAQALREPLAVIEQRSTERKLNDNLEYKDALLTEQLHRFANSLQIIASTLLSKARSAHSEEARQELQNAHHRIMSLAAMQQSLQSSTNGEGIDLRSYLSGLCETLSSSMIADEQPIALQVQVEAESVPADLAVSICRIATELIINALKHAFPAGQTGCTVSVNFQQAGPDWKLTVSDNGTGKGKPASDRTTSGFGTRIIDALAKHIDAVVEIEAGAGGRTVTITHGSPAAS